MQVHMDFGSDDLCAYKKLFDLVDVMHGITFFFGSVGRSNWNWGVTDDAVPSPFSLAPPTLIGSLTNLFMYYNQVSIKLTKMDFCISIL